MHRMCFGYLDSGADDEVTLRRSKDAFLERELHYRVLAGTKPETLDVSTRLMGADLALPFFSCPCAGNRMFHHEGEVAVAAVARERGSLYQGRKRVRNSQLQRLISRSFSTRFG